MVYEKPLDCDIVVVNQVRRATRISGFARLGLGWMLRPMQRRPPLSGRADDRPRA